MKLLIVSVLLCALMALTSATVAGSDAKESTPTVKTLPKPPNCPYGWTEHNDRCFHFITTRMTWANAEKNCLLLGANLASVHTDSEYFEIQKLTAIYSYTQAWIGGTDAAQEKLWFWSDGSTFRYSNWCSGEPSNKPTHNCLRMNYSGGKCWTDVRCAIRLPSVCAMKKDCLLE